MVHSRFSTNTFPTWALAHPYRYLSHNGEINTLKGNLNWMKAREGNLGSELFGVATSELLPLIPGNQSDSACLDNMLELLVLSGRSLTESMMMLVPEPWAGNPGMEPRRRHFYEFQASVMEPWDGPAAVCFTDGFSVGATLDRNGLRPCRYIVTSDEQVILSSEVGVLPVPPEKVIRQGRLEPGKMFVVDTRLGRIVEDDEIKSAAAGKHSYRELAEKNTGLEKIAAGQKLPALKIPLLTLQKVFGYTEEERKRVLLPMGVSAEEAISSMGTDTPLAVLSERPQLLFKYFKQLFAQVTNPPIDPIREKIVMSLVTFLGPEGDLLGKGVSNKPRIRLGQPILTDDELAKIRNLNTRTLSICFSAGKSLELTLDDLCQKAEKAVDEGVEIIILSDRDVNEDQVPIPSLLAVSAVNQHLLNSGKRARVSLIAETGEAREVHHFACLMGFGASAVNPYLAFEVLNDLLSHQADHRERYIKAINKGLLKIFSKMGISTLQSYCGAQLFEALGIHTDITNRYFNGVVSRVGGIGFFHIAKEALTKHVRAFSPHSYQELEAGGEIHFREGGEHHEWNPSTINLLQAAVKQGSATTFTEFSAQADGTDRPVSMFRDLLEINTSSNSISLDEVESAASIVKKFTTGAMSLGAISTEAHETLAVAMNRMGAKSNTGEGGEDPTRFAPKENGDSTNSAIKQVASARFGVTSHYLANAEEIQIKMAQGAKPGEGGQLPGHKVNAAIAALRHSTPGVQLISPPPHHDIYSIEDLAQLISDLKNVNPAAQISVKLVSEAGVGTVAAGVAKARADKILISGDCGGTGASPLSSIKNAGIPWEIGLAETHQTLVLNGLRSRVRIETDGQLRTGRDVIIAALLGAEEFGFATAPLIAQGCIMMRKCHLNTCPVGIATQDPLLREKFAGKPEYIVNYFFFVAEEVRTWMAKLGVRSLDALVGRTDLLKMRRFDPRLKASTVDLSLLLHSPARSSGCTEKQKHFIDQVLDVSLIEKARPAFATGARVMLREKISNFNRSTGAMLSGKIAKEFGSLGLAEDSISVQFEGSAGQSFGAFLSPGVRFELEGQSNDYVGKGLSGGKIIVYPAKKSAVPVSLSPILIGNTALYGATRGELFVAGRGGERFAVRNSGATAVIEGIGDHGCEYMTGGTVIVLGKTGRNFAAGMSGGVAYVLDEDGGFLSRCNTGLVEVEKLGHSSSEKELKTLIELHLTLTRSLKAEVILENWESTRSRFVQVIPFDYKNALLGREMAKVAHV